MNVKQKLGIFLGITILGIVLFCFVWLDGIYVQTGLLLLCSILIWLRFGIRKLIGEITLLIPFIIMVTIIYAILAGFRIGYGTEYWLRFGITRTALLISSMFYMQFMLSWISIREIIELPLKIDTMKYIILGSLLFKEAEKSYQEIELFMALIPSEQLRKRTWMSTLKMKLNCLLALLGYIVSLAAIKGEMIDAHIAQCYQGDKDEMVSVG